MSGLRWHLVMSTPLRPVVVGSLSTAGGPSGTSGHWSYGGGPSGPVLRPSGPTPSVKHPPSSPESDLPFSHSGPKSGGLGVGSGTSLPSWVAPVEELKE